jgi:hypothetical protein
MNSSDMILSSLSLHLSRLRNTAQAIPMISGNTTPLIHMCFTIRPAMCRASAETSVRGAKWNVLGDLKQAVAIWTLRCIRRYWTSALRAFVLLLLFFSLQFFIRDALASSEAA